MPPKLSQKSSFTAPKSGKPAPQKRTTLKLEPSTANAKRINPLTAFVNFSQEAPSSTLSSSKSKGKAKEVIRDPSPAEQLSVQPKSAGQLWIDAYEPQTEAELAVHVRKVENVRTWFREALEGGPSGKLRKYRRILVLTGPAGTAKSSTVRVLSREMNFEFLEWSNSVGYTLPHPQTFSDDSSSPWVADDTLFTKFQLFLERASKCQNIFSSSETNLRKRPSSSSSSTSANPSPPPTRRIILLEDLPNVLHSDTRSQFHDVMRSLIENDDPNPVPVVIILSDSGLRGEAGDERLASGSWKRDGDGAIDVRTVLPKDILHGPYVHEIRFNPIAPTLLKKALQALLNRHFTSRKSPVSSEMLNIVVESSNGDIRSAIMALQFACVRLGKKIKGTDSQILVESITRREQSLALFHLIGKVLYNKRKGDPPAPSASAKDLKKDQELDRRLKDPPKLPPHLSEHERRASRVDVNTIYADSPIDSSLFSLYIHQNYVQFCTDVDECDGIADWLSWADSSGGEAWYQINPHRFHLLALGTLHSLPTPVPRTSQKVFKPEFFDHLNKEKDAWEGVRDVRSWIIEQGSESGWNLGVWTPQAIATELGGVMRARDASSSSFSQGSRLSGLRMPSSHRSFSSLRFVYPRSDTRMVGREQLVEGDDGELYLDGSIVLEEQQEMGMWQDGKETERAESKAKAGGWLESDDIEDFEDVKL